MQLVWLGGMGVVVLAVAILPLLGVGGSQIFKAETPGPMKDAKLTPRIAETAKGLWGVYALITLACIAGLDAPDEGRVMVDGAEANAGARRQALFCG